MTSKISDDPIPILQTGSPLYDLPFATSSSFNESGIKAAIENLLLQNGNARRDINTERQLLGQIHQLSSNLTAEQCLNVVNQIWSDNQVWLQGQGQIESTASRLYSYMNAWLDNVEIPVYVPGESDIDSIYGTDEE